MEPSQGIPLHFSVELLGVAVLGSVLAWAVYARRLVLAAGSAAAVAGLIAHGGQFVNDGVPARAVAWLVAAGGLVGLGASLRRPDDRALQAGAWTAFAGARLGIALLDPHTAVDMRAGVVALHLAAAAGTAALGVWVWRRTVSSVRLRIIGAFLLTLVLVVTLGGGAVVWVVAERIEDEQLAGVEVDVRAERTVLRGASEDLLNRGTLVAQTMATLFVRGGDLTAAAREILERVFPDLAFIAVLDAERRVAGQSGLTPAEAETLATSGALTTALAGQPAPTLERTPGGLLSIGANPMYRPGAPPSKDNIVAVVLLGRRVDAGSLSQIAAERSLEAALVDPESRGVFASSGGRIAGAEIPPDARRALLDVEVWSGVVRGSDGRLFAAVAPLERADATVPVGLLLGAPDTVLQRTTLGVTRALFGGVLAATLAAVLLALWLGSRISRPIIDLTAVARRVEEGDLGAESIVASEDEIGTLARTLSSMTSSLRTTIAAERDTRQRLETIVGGMGEALVAVDADFTIVSFNPAAQQICGVSVDDAIGAKCYDVYGTATAGRDGRPICDYLCPLRHGGGADREVVLRRRRGETGLSVTCSTLYDDEGNIVGGVDLLRDVTPELEAEQMKSHFLANVGHELRTPLTAIRGFSQMLGDRKLSEPAKETAVAEIYENSLKLSRIVEILHAIAGMDTGSFALADREADPGEIARRAVKKLKDLHPDRTVTVSVGRGTGSVRGDDRHLTDAVYELLDNALKFSPDGGRVRVKVAKATRGVSIAVTDSGIGIGAEEQKNLFQAFTQGDPTSTRRFGGLGIGLYFVRRVVEGHGGRLSVSSRLRRGSTFTMVLPAARASRAAKRPASAKTRPARSRARGRRT